jgi:DNA gyrase/topoisomerase IV subunit A
MEKIDKESVKYAKKQLARLEVKMIFAEHLTDVHKFIDDCHIQDHEELVQKVMGRFNLTREQALYFLRLPNQTIVHLEVPRLKKQISKYNKIIEENNEDISTTKIQG